MKEIEIIANHISEQTGVSVLQMKLSSRRKEIVFARHVAMYYAERLTNHSLKAIGKYFGERDHSTVIHARQAIQDYLDVNCEEKSKIEALAKSMPDISKEGEI